MQRWLEEHRAFAVETFFNNNDATTVTRRVFRHFDIGRKGKVTIHQTILKWVTQFRTTASIVKKKPLRRPRTVQIPENVRRVAHAFQRSPQRSARRHSIALQLNPRTVRRILHEDLKFKLCNNFFPVILINGVNNVAGNTCKWSRERRNSCIAW